MTGVEVGTAVLGSAAVKAEQKVLEGAAKAAAAASPSKKGYRAVSDAELDDIAKHGFRPHPEGKSMQDKWFSETKEGAEKFTICKNRKFVLLASCHRYGKVSNLILIYMILQRLSRFA
jgi:hypothetical protein